MNRRELIQLALAGALPAGAQEVGPDGVSRGVVRFFSAREFADLKQLAEILMPAAPPLPGAAEAGVAEFLDFLLANSPEDIQRLYKAGLAHLDAGARRLRSKAFSTFSAAEAAPLLKPLNEPWTYAGPKEPFGGFLAAVKADVWEATVNSREWSAASRTRTGGGQGLYWLPIE